MTRFEVWAPYATTLQVAVGHGHGHGHGDGDEQELVRYSMRRAGRGRWEAEVPAAGHGSDYGFVLDGGDEVLPDPRSPWQPYGAHGISRVYEHDRFVWTDHRWRGRPLAGGVVYELHIGTFTPEGTFDSAIERLDHLVSLGIDMVEVMPVASFPGRQGWGYDGVHLWAPHEPYGGPDGLKRFVDAAHARGLAVVLDVVYNHLGPSGNRLKSFGPYFTSTYATPWGEAVNYDQEGADEVRAFVVDNALMWMRDFHIDGLRLDAVHAINDGQAVHILEHMEVAVDGLQTRLGRTLFLIAESGLNDPRLVTAREAGGYGLDAQWNDDFHHALHSALTGERQGYYCDFGSLETLAKSLTRVFVHDGTWSAYRERRHGRPVDLLTTPGYRFLGFLQNHDQVGNRAAGDRLSGTLGTGMLKVGAALVMTAPFTPMLFMGEEWGATTPFCYFTDHAEPELAQAIREGRRREFSSHEWPGEVPDPQAVDTFRRSVLDWAEPDKVQNRELLEWHRALISLRRAWPELTDPRLTEVSADYDEQGRWLVLRRGRLSVAANLGPTSVRLPIPGRLVLASNPGVRAGTTAPPAVTLPGASLAVVARDDAGTPK
ncbi:malto-oligosyltrehalose trehalohydrolase [Actinomadura barringtoniae]|uniref:Malto-oligosyltrehalose trehalohydrolase n=1 Tax=Actinomadura barringtoniae TaxID=1427535 RepID=A0A939PMU3_9ACTN|nr:malto-oligosyltrehalose trehalohydrolase [Actinomadura barringtoniae]MBO2452029.1 malto-oligosyltrehalose trehalohydrolase [Actinomadura barringtoniae]